MANILPFRRTKVLIAEIDDFLDKVSEAVLVLEQTILHYIDHGGDGYLEEKTEQVYAIEARADELRRGIINTMYTEMLMPDTRGDVLSLLDELDGVLDDCVHTVVELSMERPELSEETWNPLKAMMGEAAEGTQTLVQAARAYFNAPHTVRDYVHKIEFHNQEVLKISLRVGRAVFDSDLPLERKRQIRDWIFALREVASDADDVGARLAIYAVKRSI